MNDLIAETRRQDLANIAAAVHEASYRIVRELGILRLLRALGQKPKPWIVWRLERDDAELWWTPNPPTADRWISRDDGERSQMIEHLDGIPWWQAPIPPRLHVCAPQTRGILHDIDRCACGALRFRHGLGAGIWSDRNTRKAYP